jgi:hypothetical protein
MDPTRSKLPVASAVLAALLLVVTCLFWSARRTVAELRGEKTALERSVARAHDETMAVQGRLDSLAKTPRERGGAAAVSSESPGKSGGAKSVSLHDVLRAHPEYREVWEKEARRNAIRPVLEGDFGGLNLSADKREKLKALLAEFNLTQFDAIEAMLSAGFKPGTPEWTEGLSRSSLPARELQQSMVSMIGADGVAALGSLVATTSVEDQFNRQFAADFIDGNEPLTSDQIHAIARIAVAVQRGVPPDAPLKDPSLSRADPVSGLNPMDEEILAEAAAVLSPGQLKILRAQRREQNIRAAVLRNYPKGVEITFP